MKNLGTVAVLLTLLLAAHSPIAVSHESPELKQRVARLEATVEELTFKLSEALEQRNKLRAAMSQALQAKQQGKAVVAGCDTSGLPRLVAYAGNASFELDSWVKRNAQECTAPQLQQVLNDYNGTLYGSSKKVLRYELSIR
jgi:cell division septum initiation protein DivIVA